MSEETTTISSINAHNTFSSDRYYEIGLIAFSIGFQNTARYLQEAKYEGLQFTFIYIVLLIIIGIPLVIVELSLSQYSRKGMMKIWDLCPLFYGLGYLSFAYTFILQIEDINTSSTLLRYLLIQVLGDTDWKTCSNSWNTEYCYTPETNFSRRLDCYDLHGKEKCDQAQWSSSYYQYRIGVFNSFDNGIYQLKNAAHFLLMFSIATMVLYKGMRFMEKYLLYCIVIAGCNFTILFYYSLIQSGTGSGIKYFMFFDWTSLKDLNFWDHELKIFLWTTGLGTGCLRVLGSQNKFRGHSYINGMMIVLVVLTVAVLYKLMYLSLCGSLSYHLNLPIQVVFQNKEHIAWCIIPAMLESVKGSRRLWHGLFFSHLFLLVMSKTVLFSFILLNTISELFPQTNNHRIKTIFVMYISTLIFGFVIYTKFGLRIYIDLKRFVIKGPMITIMNLLQAIVVIYIYGLTVVVDDMHFMLGFRMPLRWQIMLFLSPIILLIFCILQLMIFYKDIIPMHVVGNIDRGIIQLVLYFPIFIVTGYAIWYTRQNIWNCEWGNVLSPSDSWYLTDLTLRKSREMFSASSMTEEYLYRQSKRRERQAYDLRYDID